MIYARHGLSPDGDNGDEDESTADDDLDIALLDYVQREWDEELNGFCAVCPSALDS